ncbi:MAG: hypothetical protein IJQ39_05310 [Thermoguttaceae bacterium]|nr:hypothetical protein [Thermoguttaceae bacterium]
METQNRFEFERLPFSAIEEYMLLDHSPAYPMDSVRLLHFSGQLDREAVEKALNGVWERQPFLRSRAVRNGRRLEWVPSEKLPEIIWENADAAPDALNPSGFPSMRPINLFQEPGCRVYVVESERENWTKILFQFHHSVSDGLGEMQILGDFVTLYAIAAGLIPPETQLRPLDFSKLPLTRRVGWTLASYLRNYFHSTPTTLALLFGRCNPLIPNTPKPRTEPTGPYPFLQSLQLTQEETRQYVQKAKKLGVTVNDLLLRDFFRTIDQWRVQEKKDFPKGSTRVMVPMSVRDPQHEDLPSVNIVSSVFLDRKKREMAGDPQTLLEGIHREMEWVKRHDQKYVFILILQIGRKLGNILSLSLKSRRCRSTGVLSNLGRVMELSPVPRNEDGTIQLGSSRLEFIDAAPPIRSQTMISFSALTYANALRLCLRYDQNFLTPSDAESFLAVFYRNLNEF